MADKYRKRLGRYHGEFGKGDIASACAGLDKVIEPFLSDKNYAACFKIIFERIVKSRY